jgi:hypothetical protein
VFGGKEREHRFNGIYSNTLALWSYMPTECLHLPDTACGVINARLSKSLLKLFDIKGGALEREMRISVFLGEERGEGVDEAKIYTEVEGKAVVFTVQSAASPGDDDRKRLRALSLERRLGNRPPEVIQITKKDIFFKAYHEIVDIGIRHKMMPVLLCGSCPAEENGLPRPVI